MDATTHPKRRLFVAAVLGALALVASLFGAAAPAAAAPADGIEGIVRDRDGTALSGIAVIAQLYSQDDGTYEDELYAETDVYGYYHIAIPGNWDVEVIFFDPDGEYATQVFYEINPYDYLAFGDVQRVATQEGIVVSDIEANLYRRGSITGTVASPGYAASDREYLGVEVLIHDDENSEWVSTGDYYLPNANGSFTIPDLEEDQYRVQAFYDGPNGYVWLESSTITVLEGQNRAIGTLTLPTPKPILVSPPTVSGTATVGSTWTLTRGEWYSATSFLQAWLRCTSPVSTNFTAVPAGCTAISGATGLSYVTTAADAGRYITAQVAAVGPYGNTLSGAISTTGLPGPTAPANTVAPTVSGTAAVGATWTLNRGTWTGNPTPTYVQAWLRCTAPVNSTWTAIPAGCTAISGANGLTYTTTTADAGRYLVAQVGGVNSAATTLVGTANTTQIPGPPPPAAPTNSVAPSVSGGTTIGSTWTLNRGTWAGNPTPTYVQAWLRCTSPVNAAWTAIPAGCTAISGANGTTYVSTAADGGKYLTAQVGAINSVGTTLLGAPSTTPMSAPPPPSAPNNISSPSIGGTADVGQTLTLSTGTWGGNPTPTIVQAWLRCNISAVTSTWTTIPSQCTAIPGARGLSYVVTADDRNRWIVAQVAASNSAGTAFLGTVSTSRVPGPIPPINEELPTVSGDVAIGSTWTLDVGEWSGTPAPTFIQAWLRCTAPVSVAWATIPAGCSAIPGARALTYVSTSADAGMYLVAQVGGVNSVSTTLVGTANTVQMTPPPPPAAPAWVTQPSVSGSSEVGSTWTVVGGSWTGSPAPTFVQAWLRCNAPIPSNFTTVPAGCVAIPGARGASYQTTSADAGKYVTAQFAISNSLGTVLGGAPNAVQMTAAPTNAPVNVSPPGVSGTFGQGFTLTMLRGEWTGTPAPTFVQAWLRCTNPVGIGFTTVPAGCTAISGANGTTYTLQAADAGKYVTAQVGAINSSGTTLSVAEATALVTAAP